MHIPIFISAAEDFLRPRRWVSMQIRDELIKLEISSLSIITSSSWTIMETETHETQKTDLRTKFHKKIIMKLENHQCLLMHLCPGQL